MKKTLQLFVILSALIYSVSCNKDDDDVTPIQDNTDTLSTVNPDSVYVNVRESVNVLAGDTVSINIFDNDTIPPSLIYKVYGSFNRYPENSSYTWDTLGNINYHPYSDTNVGTYSIESYVAYKDSNDLNWSYVTNITSFAVTR